MTFNKSLFFWSLYALATCFFQIDKAQSQVVPDTTLGRESSVVKTINREYRITGGANRGSNLFHSFERFSIPTGNSAFFVNDHTIENIIARVTGSSASFIDGLIKANGSANLFLLNSNGISFGPNARLQIGGSFTASTARAIAFADGTFLQTDPEVPTLLTISVPLGVQLNTANRSIVNGSTGNHPPGYERDFSPLGLYAYLKNLGVNLPVSEICWRQDQNQSATLLSTVLEPS